MKYVASVSMGKDSIAMFYLILEKKYPLTHVVYYDTGVDFKCIHSISEKIEQECKILDIEFVRLYSSSPFLYDMLDKPVKNRTDGTKGYSWCGGTSRWGTSKKTSAINKYLASLHDSITEYIGIAFDESHRMKFSGRYRFRYPLIENRFTEKMCLQYCRNKGITWEENGIDLYEILDRISCWCCSNKNTKELRNIYHYLPEYWKNLVDLESKTHKTIKKGKSIFDFEEQFKKEDTNDEI